MKKASIELTERQAREAIRMEKFFPLIQRGHGSQHRNIVEADVTIGHRCNAKGCDGQSRHQQSSLEAAAEFILVRDA
jgi:hypothetical protein